MIITGPLKEITPERVKFQSRKRKKYVNTIQIGNLNEHSGDMYTTKKNKNPIKTQSFFMV